MRHNATGAILLTCEYSPFPGGIATFSTQLATELRDAGLTAVVVAPAYSGIANDTHDADTYRLLAHHRVPLSSIPAVASLLNRYPRHWPVLACDIRSVLTAFALSLHRHRPYIAAIHGSEVTKMTSRGIGATVVVQAYRRATSITANSHFTLDAYTRACGLHSNAYVNYLGISSFWFEEPIGDFENDLLRAIPQSTLVVSAVGRIEARKGQLNAVQVLNHARKTSGLDDVVLVIAGLTVDETYAAAVQREAHLLRVPCITTGALSVADIRRLYRRSLCHLLCARDDEPGRVEGFGLVILEAGAQECPTIASNVGGIPEAIGHTGFMAHPNDVATMASCLASLWHSPRLRSDRGQAAKARATEFSWSACAHRALPQLAWPGASAPIR